MQFNWNDIRSLNGSQADGFEEFCAQLARAETPSEAEFVRKGTPDAGVECYCILPNEREWGWQAKFFVTLGPSQWSQIDKSVKTALDKHPNIVRYFICIPLDLSDPRNKEQKWAMQRWTERVKKWEGWVKERRMGVEFVWWGSSELLERLCQNKHVGRRYFWFGQHGYDDDWFRARLDQAVKAAGPRYTPEVHVNLPIACDLDLFGRSDSAINGVKSLARGIRKELGLVGSSDLTNELIEAGNKVLTRFSLLKYSPDSVLSFAPIIKEINAANCLASKAWNILSGQVHVGHRHDPKHQEGANSHHRKNPINQRYHIERLQSKLNDAHKKLSRACIFANNKLMILNGMAGTGKTHLLCDFAKRRIASKQPTVLLMGQRFVTKDLPWTQMRQHLDLTGITAEVFVGALETAAQAAGCRALLIIDALNEGQGRVIWPAHLAALLSVLEKSSWIGVLLSIRSTYEDVVIPEDIRNQAVSLTHNGFAKNEYNAARTFFSYYGLEFPSTPILQPEFQNPHLLKTLCLGLQDQGERSLPRGFHGITSTLDLYLKTVNKRLAKELDFNPKDLLVPKALEKIAMQMVKTGDRWLPRPKAEKIVNKVLPGRVFSKSLYHGLVTEGVLFEELYETNEDSGEEVVHIAYDRFTDHIIIDSLLRTHLDTDDPKAAFSEGGGLAFICETGGYAGYGLEGLIEALCIQIPERTGEELVTIVPSLLGRRDVGEAFRQSVVWRKPKAISKSTVKVLNKLSKTQQDSDATFDVLLTIATLKDHPLNAKFLDKVLGRKSMPDRDAWWSAYLHRAWSWDDSGAVRRIVDWTLGVTKDTDLDEKTVDLCAIALAWMFTTSNRFLRDRATKALVSLLTGRFDVATRLVNRFSDVDDPYVAERTYAVAYGVAMRSHDAIGVGRLASMAYEKVFAIGTPPVHILLRDYARGVIERAIYLGSDLEEVNVSLIKPPYNSTWPKIPNEEEIQPLIPDLNGDLQKRDLAKRIIVSSVLGGGDFASYIIGTNTHSTSWLSLRLDKDPWRSIKAREEAFRLKLSDSERSAWEEYKDADHKLSLKDWLEAKLVLKVAEQKEDQIIPFDIPSEGNEPSEKDVEAEQAFEEKALRTLRLKLAPDHLSEFEDILKAKNKDEWTRPPLFDLKLIQRYVLWRVFNLGWTTQRFGKFDESVRRHSHGREASKPERIGKKYQWIAYHEILAYIADHYQFYQGEHIDEDRDCQTYKGPWQGFLRDIDPSCLLLSKPGGTSLKSDSPSWWSPVHYENWDEASRHWDWIRREDNIPEIIDFLSVKQPGNGTRWLNVSGNFNCQQPLPADVEPYDVEQRYMWFICHGYLLRAKDADTFIDWARNVDFWGRWMPEPAETSRMFLGEYGWSPAFRNFNQPWHGFCGWTKPEKNWPVSVLPVLVQYIGGGLSFDCSADESYLLQLPYHDIVKQLGLKWTRLGANFVDQEDRLAAFDPTAHEANRTALLIREDLLRQYLSNQGLALCWTILGEKRVQGGNRFLAADRQSNHGTMRISGAYKYSDQGPKGFLKFFPNKPEKKRADPPTGTQ